MLQRNKEWFDSRAGKFTASKIHCLMGIKGLGQTGLTYITEQAIEEVFGINEDDSLETWDMKRGIELEPFAFDLIKEKKGLEFVDVVKCGFFKYGDHCGASPDGLIGDDAVLEIKCPRPNKFFKTLSTKEIDKEYFYQMQMQMMAADREKAVFFNYCIYNGKSHGFEIEVPFCENTVSIMKDRIEEAIEIKKTIITELVENSKYLYK